MTPTVARWWAAAIIVWTVIIAVPLSPPRSAGGSHDHYDHLIAVAALVVAVIALVLVVT